MTDSDRELGRAVRSLIRRVLEERPELGSAVAALARVLHEEVERLEPAANPPEHEPPPVEPAPQAVTQTMEPPPASPPLQVVVPQVSSGFVPLKIGDAVMHVRVNGTTAELGRARVAGGADEPKEQPARPTVDVDLGLVQERCRIKAQSCLAAIERRAAPPGSAREQEAVAVISDMIRRAKAMPTCFLWSVFREKPQPGDELLRTIAEGYEAIADAAELLERLEEDGADRDPQLLQRAMELTAEASSGLRILLEGTWLSQPDVDQDQIHLWLVQETAARRVYIQRYMRLDDPADAQRLGAVRTEIAGLLSQHQRAAEQMKAIRAALKRVRYHVRQVLAKPPEEGGYDWSKIAAAAEELMGLGVRAADRRLLDVLAPVVGEEYEPHAPAPLLPHLAAARAAGQDPTVEVPQERREWSERVLRVRSLIAGRRLVMVGGEPRPEARQRLIEAFALDDCEWVHLSEHGSGRLMQAPIQRPGTCLVLVLIRLVGHLQADEAREYARKAGVPCVLVKAGYNPEQIAEAILEQAAQQLGAAAYA